MGIALRRDAAPSASAATSSRSSAHNRLAGRASSRDGAHPVARAPLRIEDGDLCPSPAASRHCPARLGPGAALLAGRCGAHAPTRGRTRPPGSSVDGYARPVGRLDLGGRRAHPARPAEPVYHPTWRSRVARHRREDSSGLSHPRAPTRAAFAAAEAAGTSPSWTGLHLHIVSGARACRRHFLTTPHAATLDASESAARRCSPSCALRSSRTRRRAHRSPLRTDLARGTIAHAPASAPIRFAADDIGAAMPVRLRPNRVHILMSTSRSSSQRVDGTSARSSARSELAARTAPWSWPRARSIGSAHARSALGITAGQGFYLAAPPLEAGGRAVPTTLTPTEAVRRVAAWRESIGLPHLIAAPALLAARRPTRFGPPSPAGSTARAHRADQVPPSLGVLTLAPRSDLVARSATTPPQHGGRLAVAWPFSIRCARIRRPSPPHYGIPLPTNHAARSRCAGAAPDSAVDADERHRPRYAPRAVSAPPRPRRVPGLRTTRREFLSSGARAPRFLARQARGHRLQAGARPDSLRGDPGTRAGRVVVPSTMARRTVRAVDEHGEAPRAAMPDHPAGLLPHCATVRPLVDRRGRQVVRTALGPRILLGRPYVHAAVHCRESATRSPVMRGASARRIGLADAVGPTIPISWWGTGGAAPAHRSYTSTRRAPARWRWHAVRARR